MCVFTKTIRLHTSHRLWAFRYGRAIGELERRSRLLTTTCAELALHTERAYLVEFRRSLLPLLQASVPEAIQAHELGLLLRLNAMNRNLRALETLLATGVVDRVYSRRVIHSLARRSGAERSVQRAD